MRVNATYNASAELRAFIAKLEGPTLRDAAVRGLNEHAQEQRRQSVKTMTRMTGLPAGRVSSVTRYHPAGGSLTAKVVVSDRAIGLHEYGSPSWVTDLKPKGRNGKFSGPRSSSVGASATGWNRRKAYRGAFIGKGMVMIRKGSKLKVLSGPVLANELVHAKKTNSKTVSAYMDADLAQRVIRHVSLALGT